jgi:hypothetical protein
MPAKKSKTKKGGLGKWFNEQWIDVKTGKPCGRKKKDSKRPYEAKKKTSSKRVKWSTTASGRKRKKA